MYGIRLKMILIQGITVLVATSRDTGGAVAKGFEGLDGINVCILYPKRTNQ